MGRFKMRGGFESSTWIFIIIAVVVLITIALAVGLTLGLKKTPPADPQTPSSNFVKPSSDLVLPVSVTLENPQVVKKPPINNTFPATLLFDVVASNPDAYENNSTINYDAKYFMTDNRDSEIVESNLLTAPPGNLSIDISSTDIIRILSVNITVWINYRGVIGPKAYYNYDPIRGLKRI